MNMTATHGTSEAKKETLVRDIKGIVDDANEVVKDMAGSTAEGFAAARTKVEGKVDDMKARLDAARLAATERAKAIAGATNDYVKENPWRVLGTAALAGLVIGFLLRRR